MKPEILGICRFVMVIANLSDIFLVQSYDLKQINVDPVFFKQIKDLHKKYHFLRDFLNGNNYDSQMQRNLIGWGAHMYLVLLLFHRKRHRRSKPTDNCYHWN